MRREDFRWGLGVVCGLVACLLALPLLPLARFLGWVWARGE